MSGLAQGRMLSIVTAIVGLTTTTACVAKESPPVTLTLGVPERANEYVSLASHGKWVVAACRREWPSCRATTSHPASRWYGLPSFPPVRRC